MLCETYSTTSLDRKTLSKFRRKAAPSDKTRPRRQRPLEHVRLYSFTIVEYAGGAGSTAGERLCAGELSLRRLLVARHRHRGWGYSHPSKPRRVGGSLT